MRCGAHRERRPDSGSRAAATVSSICARGTFPKMNVCADDVQSRQVVPTMAGCLCCSRLPAASAL